MYKLYFDAPDNHARIHRNDCPKAGRGRLAGASGATSLWTTSIATLEEARALAKRLVDTRRDIKAKITECDCITAEGAQ